MKRLEIELVCCLRSLILLWEARSPPKRPVSPPLDSQRMASFVGTGSDFFFFFSFGTHSSQKQRWQLQPQQTGHSKEHMRSPTSHVGIEANSNISKTPLPAKTSAPEQLGASTAALHLRLLLHCASWECWGQAYLGWPLPVVSSYKGSILQLCRWLQSSQ